MKPRQPVVLALIFLVVYFGHLSSPNVQAGDSRWAIYVAQSLVKEGNTNIKCCYEDYKASQSYSVDIRGYYFVFHLYIEHTY
jgi:hypothetical protein